MVYREFVLTVKQDFPNIAEEFAIAYDHDPARFKRRVEILENEDLPFYTWIDRLLDWGETPQGHQYWDDVYEQFSLKEEVE